MIYKTTKTDSDTNDVLIINKSDRMKSFIDFYTESVELTEQSSYETTKTINERILKRARVCQDDYIKSLRMDGLFGFNEIPLNSDVVPSDTMLYITPHCTIQSPVIFEVDQTNDTITQRQIDALNICVSFSNVASKTGGIGHMVTVQLGDTSGIDKNIEDIITMYGPLEIKVPIQKEPNEYTIYVGYYIPDDLVAPNKFMFEYTLFDPSHTSTHLPLSTYEFSSIENFIEMNHVTNPILSNKFRKAMRCHQSPSTNNHQNGNK